MENTPTFSCANGRGRGRRSLSGLETDRDDLRRPYKNPATANSTDQSGENSVPRIISTLSAEAPEFVPRFYSNPSQPQIQPDLSSNISPFQQASIPDTNLFSSYGDQSLPILSGPQLKYVNHPVILQVNDMVVNLTRKPHKFDQIATQMTSVLSWRVKDEDLMKEIISVIFEQGVGEPNFRFNGARLCQHLSKHVTQAYDGQPFRPLLFQKCQGEYSYREYYLQSEPTRLCGFTLFLADIFTHLLTPAAQPFHKLREGIQSLLMTLMSSPNSTNLKCVAQVLKGTGNLLDAGGREEMEVVMCRLKDVAMSSAIPVDIRTLLLSLIELRAANWGRTTAESTQEPSSSAPTEADVPHIGTVYYGPGGEIRHVEEEVEDSASDTDDSSYYGLSLQGDELEGEVAKAFEQFLREQQQPPQH